MKPHQLDARLFYDKFADRMSQLITLDNYTNKGLTEIIRNEKVITVIIEEANLTAYPEYYTVDYTGWHCTKTNPCTFNSGTSLNQYDWELQILVEHENNCSDWTYEVAKLSFFRCPLRVVIGYTDDKSCDEQRLSCAAHQIKRGCISDGEEFLIILGEQKFESIEKSPKFGYTAYVCNGSVSTNDEYVFEKI